MADRDAWEQRLYRFARVLLRDESDARSLVLDTLAAAAKRPPAGDLDRFVTRLFQEVRRCALKQRPSAASVSIRGELPEDADGLVRRCDGAAFETALHALPEPGRSALALLVLDAFEPDWIARLLGLPPEDFAEALRAARLGLCAALTSTGAPRS